MAGYSIYIGTQSSFRYPSDLQNSIAPIHSGLPRNSLLFLISSCCCCFLLFVVVSPVCLFCFYRERYIYIPCLLLSLSLPATYIYIYIYMQALFFFSLALSWFSLAKNYVGLFLHPVLRQKKYSEGSPWLLNSYRKHSTLHVLLKVPEFEH